jgi:hypothetical protein
LEEEHEGDPLVVGRVRRIVRRLHAVLGPMFRFGKFFRRKIGDFY